MLKKRKEWSDTSDVREADGTYRVTSRRGERPVAANPESGIKDRQSRGQGTCRKYPPGRSDCAQLRG